MNTRLRAPHRSARIIRLMTLGEADAAPRSSGCSFMDFRRESGSQILKILKFSNSQILKFSNFENLKSWTRIFGQLVSKNATDLRNGAPESVGGIAPLGHTRGSKIFQRYVFWNLDFPAKSMISKR